MLIKKPSDINPSEITSKSDYQSRRKFLKNSFNIGLTGTAINSGILLPGMSAQAAAKIADIKKSPLSTTDEELTKFKDITTYNNFYEFGINKEDPSENSGLFQPKPWSVSIEGECNKPGEYNLEDLINPHQLEERIYRMRCVEAWSMVIPWVGIPLADILKRFEPNANAKYVAFTTVFRPDEMPGQRSRSLRWPYVEGLRIDEAMNPLTLLAVGLYGEELLNQNGAPMRLVVPWKYGYKGIKSINKIEFVTKEPPTSWNISAPKEYGFYSNVNPKRNHPRWSQKKERRIGEFLKRDTLMFNGYEDQVASMYTEMNLLKYH
ncbi:MAG: sulfoxide reductase catalytic subunit YedY [Gammaproteobacteria bacterium]|jgi:sulfoxide reductase catalytic subunit YedY